MTPEQDQTKEPTIFNSLLVCFFVSILLFIALLFRQQDLSLLAILILLVMGGSKAWSTLNFYHITCHYHADKQRVFPGEIVSMASTIENRKFLPVWVRLHWPKHAAFEAVHDMEPISRHGAGLLWHQQMQIQQEFTAIRRGVFHVGPPRLGSSDFFGFFHKEKKLGKPFQVLVYPRLVPIKTIFLPKQDWFDTPGANSPIKDPVYILGTQDYQPSRPSRHIHWKASARRLQLQEKVFEPSEFGTILLALDVGAFEKNSAEDAFEHTLEVIASLSIKLDESGQAVGLMTNGIMKGGGAPTVAPARSTRQLPAILETLARLRMKQHRPMGHAIQQAPFKRQGVSCVLFSYAYGEDTAESKHILQERRIPVTTFVSHSHVASDSAQQQTMTGVHPIDDIRLQRENPS
jgi:uncharacterized protein (DUF58 family)